MKRRQPLCKLRTIALLSALTLHACSSETDQVSKQNSNQTRQSDDFTKAKKLDTWDEDSKSSLLYSNQKRLFKQDFTIPSIAKLEEKKPSLALTENWFKIEETKSHIPFALKTYLNPVKSEMGYWDLGCFQFDSKLPSLEFSSISIRFFAKLGFNDRLSLERLSINTGRDWQDLNLNQMTLNLRTLWPQAERNVSGKVCLRAYLNDSSHLSLMASPEETTLGIEVIATENGEDPTCKVRDGKQEAYPGDVLEISFLGTTESLAQYEISSSAGIIKDPAKILDSSRSSVLVKIPTEYKDGNLTIDLQRKPVAIEEPALACRVEIIVNKPDTSPNSQDKDSTTTDKVPAKEEQPEDDNAAESEEPKSGDETTEEPKKEDSLESTYPKDEDTAENEAPKDDDSVVDEDDDAPIKICRTIDFDSYAGDGKFKAGEYVEDQYEGVGISFSAENNKKGHPNQLIIFDSSNPTGGDTDLRTPGAGTGNDSSMKNIAIIAENVRDTNRDGYVDNPDDEARGGRIMMTMENANLYLHELTIIDAEERDAKIEIFHGTNDRETKNIPRLNDNSKVVVGFKAAKPTEKAVVHFPASGGLDNIKICNYPKENL